MNTIPKIITTADMAMLNKDLNAMSAVVMILGIVFITVNILSDMVVAYLDPRVRLLGGGNE